ncbi:MAG TPA: hypothetical protein VF974_00725 [Patescibacteria group bacterium]
MDNYGLGYGMLFWDDLIKESQAGSKIIDSETGKELSVEYMQSQIARR